MALTLITAPTEEPVSVEEAKEHLRVDVADEDTLIEGLIMAAREWAESIQGRAYITQTWELVLDAFPEINEIKIPLPPLQSVVSVKYKDEDGNESTFDAGSYIVDTDSQPGRVVLAGSQTWPNAALYPAAAVRIRFTAGYGAAAAVPERAKQAIKLLVGHLYEHREAVAADARLREIPLGVKRLLQLDRIMKV